MYGLRGSKKRKAKRSKNNKVYHHVNTHRVYWHHQNFREPATHRSQQWTVGDARNIMNMLHCKTYNDVIRPTKKAFRIILPKATKTQFNHFHLPWLRYEHIICVLIIIKCWSTLHTTQSLSPAYFWTFILNLISRFMLLHLQFCTQPSGPKRGPFQSLMEDTFSHIVDAFLQHKQNTRSKVVEIK